MSTGIINFPLTPPPPSEEKRVALAVTYKTFHRVAHVHAGPVSFGVLVSRAKRFVPALRDSLTDSSVLRGLGISVCRLSSYPSFRL